MREAHAVNPFVVPGQEAAPLAPLDPDADPGQERYYVPVDRTEQAFQQFTSQLSPDELLSRGRLVVVTGQRGCGKTSLINRCVRRARTALEERTITPLVVDLTGDARVTEPVSDRIRRVCLRLIDELYQRRAIEDRTLREIQEEPERAYPYLGGALVPERAVVIVRLPVSEVVRELADYARLARRKLLFFAETSYRAATSYRLDHELAGLPGNPHRPDAPMLLQVGPLEPDDGVKFVRDRFARLVDRGGVPQLPDATMRRVRWQDLTVGLLQQLLYEVYQHADRRAEPLDVVSFEQLQERLFHIMIRDYHAR
jgi:hypothetical protein